MDTLILDLLKLAVDDLSGKLHNELEDRVELLEAPPEIKSIDPDFIQQGVLREVMDDHGNVISYARIRMYQENGKDPKYSIGIKHFPLNQESEAEISKEMFDSFYPNNLDKPQEKNRYKLNNGWIVDVINDGTIFAEKEKKTNKESKIPEHWVAA